MAIYSDGEEKYYWEPTDEYPTYESAVEDLELLRASAATYLEAADLYKKASYKYKKIASLYLDKGENLYAAGDIAGSVAFFNEATNNYNLAKDNINLATDAAKKSLAASLAAEEIQDIITKNRRAINPGYGHHRGYGRRR